MTFDLVADAYEGQGLKVRGRGDVAMVEGRGGGDVMVTYDPGVEGYKGRGVSLAHLAGKVLGGTYSEGKMIFEVLYRAVTVLSQIK